jgi:hypothetical protein
MRSMARMFAAFVLSAAASNLAFGQSKATGGPTPSPEGAKVYFVDLKDGATIGTQTTLHFGLHGMGVAPAGSDKANSGHHHLLIDAELPPLDEPIPNDEHHMHFGAGQTEVDLTLTPGPHTLQLLLGDKGHVPHSPPVMSEVIHVTVTDAATPPVVAAAPAPAPADAGARRASPPGARVYIVSPENGASVPLTFLVRFGLDKMEVVRAGVDAPNSGHHHLLIDAPLPPTDEPIPNDENHLHFGAAQTEATVTLTPGKHTLQLLLGDAHHMQHVPPVYSQPVTVFAGEPGQAKAPGPAEAPPQAAAPAPRKQALHKEATHARHPPPPSPRAWARERMRPYAHERARRYEREPTPYERAPPPESAASSTGASGFDDLRHCPAGEHSQSAPTASGYRCVPNM